MADVSNIKPGDVFSDRGGRSLLFLEGSAVWLTGYSLGAPDGGNIEITKENLSATGWRYIGNIKEDLYNLGKELGKL